MGFKPSKTALRAILFDKDGTLIDFHKSWAPVLRASALDAAHGDVALAERLLIKGGMNPRTGITAPDTLFASGHTGEIAASFIKGGAAYDHAALITLLDAHFIAAADHAVPVTDLADFFSALRGDGFQIGIASSDSEEAIWRMLARFGASALVDFVAGYDSGHGVKPGPGMALGFCATIGASTAEIAVVGDNLHDLRMGRAAEAGLVVGVLSGTGSPERLQAEADVVLPSIIALPEYLQHLQGA